MRYDFLSSATWSSHIDRLVINELEKTSQGAPSGPSICVLKLMPFALIRIAKPFASGKRFSSLREKILQQPQQGCRRGGRHEMPRGLDQLETRAGNFFRQL